MSHKTIQQMLDQRADEKLRRELSNHFKAFKRNTLIQENLAVEVSDGSETLTVLARDLLHALERRVFEQRCDLARKLATEGFMSRVDRLLAEAEK